jgi:hypothetical protein
VGYFASVCGFTVLEVIWAFEKWLIRLRLIGPKLNTKEKLV